MRTQGNDSYIDFSIMNLVDHAILFVNTPRPRFFKDVVLQVLNLTCACSRMLLKFQKHIRDFLDGGFVATLLDSGNLFLCLFGKKYCVSHFLQGIYKIGNVFFILKTREFCSGLMSLGYIFLDSIHITRVGKEGITRWTYLIRINTVRTLLGLTDGNPFYRTQNLFKAWDKTCILDVKNYLCHKQTITICVQR